MTELDKLRKEINKVDKELVSLFEKRMKLVKEIGKYKKENNLPVLDMKREEEVKARNLALVKEEELKKYYEELLDTLLKVSKEYQGK